MTIKKKKLTQQDLRQLGCLPGRMVRRYPAGEDRARVEQLTSEAKAKPGPPFGPGLTHRGELTRVTRDSERS